MYCDETYLYYDCLDIDMYEPNMENDVFIIVDKCCRLPLQLMEESAVNDETVDDETVDDEKIMHDILEYVTAVRQEFQTLQKKYNDLIGRLEEMRAESMDMDEFYKQFVSFDNDKYEAFSRVYNKIYREKISLVADFWNDKLSQYERFDDGWDIGEPDDEQSEGTEEETVFDINDL